MKVAFYLDNEKHKGVDYSNPLNGNPGIGGTQYMIWSISFYLKKLYDDIDIVILAPIIESLPKELKRYKCMSLNEALYKAKDLEVDVLVFRGPVSELQIYDTIDRLKIKSISWAHNYENYDELTKAYKCKYLKRNVCVSKQQYDRLRDHDIYKKSTYIYNALDFNLYKKYICKNEEKEKVVCFMGALHKSKGFHKLAKAWPGVIKSIPDAKLSVIGSGALYDKKSEMGKFGLSSDKYEKKFMKYLLDDKGNIHKSVKFHGVLGGEEKLKIISNSCIGIVNPNGRKETFCIVGVEFQALGVPIITRRKYGICDTTNENSCIYVKRTSKSLEKAIIDLLCDNKKRSEYSYNASKFVNDNFDIKLICEKWRELFEEIIDCREMELSYKTDNYSVHLKWLREINRVIGNGKLPSILWYKDKIIKIRDKIGNFKKWNKR